MMAEVSILVVADGVNELCPCPGLDVDGAIREQLTMWNEGNEDPRPEMACIVLVNGVPLCTMLKLDSDPELCRITYTFGEVVTWRCHYVLDAEGSYVSTEITLVE